MRHEVATLLGAAPALVAALASASASPYTPKHEAGRCAFRGQCGKQSFFGKELPCVDNDLAKDPDAELRKELVDLCGAEWGEGPVCCTLEQVRLMFFVCLNILRMSNSVPGSIPQVGNGHT